MGEKKKKSRKAFIGKQGGEKTSRGGEREFEGRLQLQTIANQEEEKTAGEVINGHH